MKFLPNLRDSLLFLVGAWSSCANTRFYQANGLAPNWGQTIFQTANEINANTAFLSRLDEIQSKTEAEKEWWEKRRAAISEGFMKELDEEGDKKTSSDDGVLVDATTPAERPQSSSGGKKKKGKK